MVTQKSHFVSYIRYSRLINRAAIKYYLICLWDYLSIFEFNWIGKKTLKLLWNYSYVFIFMTRDSWFWLKCLKTTVLDQNMFIIEQAWKPFIHPIHFYKLCGLSHKIPIREISDCGFCHGKMRHSFAKCCTDKTCSLLIRTQGAW